MKSKIDFVFFGNDEVARSALGTMKKYGLSPGESGDVAVLVSYGKIIPKDVIDSFKYGVLNIHPSLLPVLRGPSPIKSAILDDLAVTGTSIILLDEQIDHGPILVQEEITLSPQVSTEQELRLALFEKGADLLARVLPDYIAGKLIPKPQDHDRATYTRKFRLEDTYLPYTTWSSGLQVAQGLERKVRALSEEPGTYSMLNVKSKMLNGGKGKLIRVKILKAKVENSEFVPVIVQPEGKRKMDWQSFLRGNRITD